ncbi:MAG: S1 RNA-binding domain-containing protein [Epulopiscium sp.]|nr:S1 RNA-binding domain-containing protein [Candidatus Epulonipiscium sp.]
MIKLGEIQKLRVLRITSIGAYLNTKEGKKEEDVLLPKKQIPEDTEVGDELEVFIYRDSKDRIIATTKRPRVTLGKLAILKVVDTSKIGAFLDWGLEKDLFLPFREQATRVSKGKSYLVGLYIDKSDRLCATMDVYDLLRSDSPYKENDKVCGIVYKVKEDLGVFVAVDSKYHGFIPSTELYEKYQNGDEIEGRVIKIREDGKIDISVREKAYIQVEEDAKVILGKLLLKGGKLPFNDNTDPSIIKKEFNMSKRAFKRAIGKLFKEGKIKITTSGIEEFHN